MFDQAMRIVHFDIDSLGAPYGGGQARRTFEVDRRLARRHDVTVVTAGHASLKSGRIDGVNYIRTLALPFPLNFGAYFLELIPRALIASADIIVEDFSFPVMAAGLPMITKTPVVGVASFLFSRQVSERYHIPFDRWATWALKKYRYIITVSAADRRTLQGVAVDADVRHIPNAADEDAFLERWDGDADYIAYMGRIDWEQKGVDLLLDAVQWVPERIELRIAGDGPAREWLTGEIARRQLKGRVKLVGRLSGQERHRFLARAKAVAFPSRYETSPLTPLDALAVGAPLVAFDIENLREMYAGTVELIEPFNAEAFGNALARFAMDRLFAEDASARGKKFASTYRWDRTAEIQEQFFEEVLATGILAQSRDSS